MKWSFDARIERARELAAKHSAAHEVLNFYRELAIFQKTVAARVQSNAITDVGALAPYFPALIDLVDRCGPTGLGENGKTRLAGAAAETELLQSAWEEGVSNTLAADPYGRFFARVLLQPFAEYLASRGDVRGEPEARVCPFCNSWPVAGVLHPEGDGAKRWLLCAVCSTEWPFRRQLCWNCGEENKDKLPIYTAPEFDSIRVDACDNCHIYIKSIDLTKDGHAVPIVDELAAVPLDIWAEEHGYSKLEPNLLGM